MDGIDIKCEYISKTIARVQTIAEIRALGIDVSDAYRKKVELDYEGLPNADVVEVRHGYWFKDEKFYHDIMVDGNPVCLYHTCSVCGVADEYITVNERPNGTHVIARSVRKYCPNCGAIMDGEEQEHDTVL